MRTLRMKAVCNGRHFTDFTEPTLRKFLADSAPGLSVEQLWTTGDVRPGRESEQWLNVILRKRFMYYSRDLGQLSLNHALLARLTDADYAAIRDQMRHDLEDYYARV